MKRILLPIALLIACSSSILAARGHIQGTAVYPQLVTTAGSNSTNKFTRVLASATVTVYCPPTTTTICAIYSDAAGTIKANPFTAGSDGSYSFYTDAQSVSIRFSNVSGVLPFTTPDIPVSAADTTIAACGGTNDTSLLSTANAAGGTIVIPNGVVCTSNSQTLSVAITIQNGGLLKPITGQVVTLTGEQNKDVWQKFTNALSGQGTVSFNGNTKISRFHPEWWGIATDGVTDDTAAFKAAEAARTLGSTLVLPLGISLLTDASVVVDMTKPGTIEGYGDGTVLRFKSGTATSVPMVRINPPAGGGEVYSTRKNVFGYTVRNFTVDAEVSGQGGDIIQIYNSAATHSAYQTDISGIISFVVGGYDVRVNNDNGAGGANDGNGSIHLHIHDCGFTNGLYLKYASDSLKVINCAFYNSTAGAGKRALEAWFIAGAANITLQDNSFVMDGGVVFHNGININVIHCYFETSNSVGSNGALLDFAGDFAQIIGGRVAGNLFVRLNPSTLNGVRVHNAKNIDMRSMNYASGQAGTAAVITTTSADSLYYGNQNVVGAGAGIIDGTNTASKGVYYEPSATTDFASKPAVPRPSTILTIVNCTLGSNPLTIGAVECKAIYQGGLWKSL